MIKCTKCGKRYWYGLFDIKPFVCLNCAFVNVWTIDDRPASTADVIKVLKGNN